VLGPLPCSFQAPSIYIDDTYKIFFCAHQTNHYYLSCIQTSICISSILVIVVKLKEILLMVSNKDIIYIIHARNNTWYAEVALPKTNSWLNQSLLGISEGIRCCPRSELQARDLTLVRSHLFLPFSCHDKLPPLDPMWLLRPGRWAV
jgi:hypothetical protein